MKAKIVSLIAYGSILDFAHGCGQEIKCLVVEKDGKRYAISTPYMGHSFVISKFKFSKDVKLVGEIDVPDDLVKRIFEADEVQKQLYSQVKKFIES